MHVLRYAYRLAKWPESRGCRHALITSRRFKLRLYIDSLKSLQRHLKESLRRIEDLYLRQLFPPIPTTNGC